MSWFLVLDIVTALLVFSTGPVGLTSSGTSPRGSGTSRSFTSDPSILLTSCITSPSTLLIIIVEVKEASKEMLHGRQKIVR
jgi:hypothetical protein